MITDYTVVSAINTALLVDTVYEHICLGWTPLGGVCVSFERNIHREIGPSDINLPNDFEHYAQALVKYD